MHEEAESSPFAPLEVDEEHLALVRNAMHAVIHGPTGTARGSRPRGMLSMAGKTGTSQVRRITVRGQDQSMIPWEERHHALFVGYAPVKNPRYAVSVVVEHGGSGSSMAAPIARAALQRTMEIRGGA